MKKFQQDVAIHQWCMCIVYPHFLEAFLHFFLGLDYIPDIASKTFLGCSTQFSSPFLYHKVLMAVVHVSGVRTHT